MANLSEDIQCAGSDTRPPMLDKADFASWQQRIRLYCRGKDNGVNILKSIDEGPFQMGNPSKMRRIAVKLNKGLKDSNFDQLYAYMKQHEAHANEHKGRQNRGQGNNARGAGVVGYGRAQNRVGNANPGQARQVKCYNCNWVGHIARHCTQPKRQFYDEDVDDANGSRLSLLWIMCFKPDDYQFVDEAGLSYDSDVLSEVHDHDHYQDAVCDHHEEHEMHDDEQVELYERRARFELTEREQKIDEQLRIVICDRNIKEENLKKELHSVKLQLASTIQHNKLMVDEVTSLKKDFNQKENKYLEEFLDLKALKDKVEDKLFKQGQSIQTVHMMCKPRSYYDEVNKVAIGYKNPLCLHRARQAQPALYSGHVIVTSNHAAAVVRDEEETLELTEISRKKMHDKMKANECVYNKINITPSNYSKENFLATFTSQKQLTPKQIFWSQDIVKMKDEAKLQTREHQNNQSVTVVSHIHLATLSPRVLPSKVKGRKMQRLAALQGIVCFVQDYAGVNSCTDASGSQPRSILKKHRIPPAKSDSLKKVEDHSRTIRPSLKTTNRVDSSISSKRTVVQIVLWYLDSGCSKHMTGDRSRLMNFVKKFIGTVRFGNDHFGAIMGYGDYVIGESVISRVYYVEGLGHNLFSVGQFCDSDLEVAFRKHSCYVRDTDGVELLKGSRGSNLYTISVEDMMKSSPICLLSKASRNKSWLWHRRLNHLKTLIDACCKLSMEENNLVIVDDKLSNGLRGYGFEIKAPIVFCGLSRATACNNTNPFPIHKSHDKTPYEVSEILGTATQLLIMESFVWLCTKQEAPDLSVQARTQSLAPANNPIPNVAQDPVIPTGPSVSIAIDLDAPSGSHTSSPLDHHSSSVHHGLAGEPSAEVNPFAAADPEPFVNVFAPDYNSEASSSGEINIPESRPKPLNIMNICPDNWNLTLILLIAHWESLKYRYPQEKQLATDALWCFYNSVLSKVEPKNFQSAATEDCWFQAMQDEIHEFDRLDVWELVPPPDSAMIIALKWIYKVKLDEYGDVLKNKARLLVKRISPRYQSRPTKKHLSAVKRSYRYLQGTINMGLWYPKDIAMGTNSIRRRISCSWSSKKQTSTSISSTEAEYITMSGCYAQILWMRSQLSDYGLLTIASLCNVTTRSAIAICCNKRSALKDKTHRHPSDINSSETSGKRMFELF
ncbi:retrovirus-related pol polyprotein from transposon TNT 1-94 [Tanacetum coccineum]